MRGSTPIIGQALAVMGVAAVFAAVTTPLGSMLQAVGYVELPVILVLGGLLVKVVLNYVLVGIPEINILGGGISTLVCYVLVTVEELVALVRITGIRFDFMSTVVKPLLAALLCGASAFGAWRALETYIGGSRLSAAPAILVGAVVYTAALLLLRAVQAEDLAMLPGGEKIIKRFQKYLQKAGG